MYTDIDQSAPDGNSLYTPGYRRCSAIERRFPHIANELTSRWGQGTVDVYLDSLLIDYRGGRLGFPEDVLEELVFLAGVRWYIVHASSTLVDENRMEAFQFGVTDWVQTKHLPVKDAWLLV